MSERPVANVMQMIEERGLAGAQVLVIALCALVALFDGMDLQSIGLAAPLMTAALHVAPQAFGPVFSAALAGLALGALALGPLADRIGRKRVLIGATLGFGVFTLCTAFAGGLGELLVYRFLTGVGLGGAMPSFVSLSCEYVPRRLRASVVSLMWAGFPLGGVVGGLLASRLIPAFGWRSVFFAGGAPPLLLAIALALALPESLGYLIKTGAPAERVAQTLRRVFGDAAASCEARFVATQSEGTGARVSDLFASGRAAGTLLLWTAFFFAFLILVTNSAWSPTLLGAAGVPIDRSAVALAVFNFGSLFGSGAAGWLLTRFGTIAVLPGALAGSAAAYSAAGLCAPSIVAVAALQGLFGLFAGCASSALIALGAVVYPTGIRATGVGWAMAAGRCGSFVGPLVVAGLVGARWPVASIFAAIGALVLVGALAALALGMRERSQGEPISALAELVPTAEGEG
ncbi:MAG TPA: MFS transporter [Roseiarcus sp.]|nr:MFS transporter [Roseiarcus sp.]